MTGAQIDLLPVGQEGPAARDHDVDLVLAVSGVVVLGAFRSGRQAELVDLDRADSERRGERLEHAAVVRFDVVRVDDRVSHGNLFVWRLPAPPGV